MSMKRSLLKTAFLSGALAYSVPTFYIARFPWMRSHYVPALAGILAAVGLVYWLFYAERSSQVPQARSAWSIWFSGGACFLAGSVLAWNLIMQAGHWRYAVVDAKVARSGLRPEPPADDVQDKSERNGQMLLLRLEDDKDFKSLFSSAEAKGNPLEEVMKALSAAAGREPGLPAALTALRPRRARWQTALKLLRQAQAAPVFSWNVRRSGVRHDQVEIPTMAYLLKVVRVACVEALFLDMDGDHAGAERQLVRAQWLADKVAGQPNLIGPMIATAMQGIICDAATPLYKRGAGGALLAGRDPGSLQRAFRLGFSYELLYAPPAARGMSYGAIVEGGPEGTASKVLGFIYQPWIDWDIAGGLEGNLEGLACLDGSLMQAQRCLAARGWENSANGWLLQAITWPKYDQLLLRVGVATARQEIAYLSRKAGVFHQERHRWPSGYGELPQLRELPDPFTGQPLITRVKNGRFELISVGSDGKEDGDQSAEGLAKDIVVRF